MCGISGYYCREEKLQELEESLYLISHRGPDSFGKMTCNFRGKLFIGLGHVRLSILDISAAGNQPMVSHDKKVIMVFNGEIYNHKELRARMFDQVFTSHSDSEILLEHYCRFGVSGFSDLRGMFCATFYEVDSGKIVMVRDQIGVKPLYYTKTKTGFYFSSEIRGLRPFVNDKFQISRESLFEFMSCGFVYEPATGFENVFKIPAGSYVVIQGDSFSLEKYFDIDQETRGKFFSQQLIEDAVKRQLVADAKIGVFFSGGIDSTIIAAFAKKPVIFAKYNHSEIAPSGSTNDEPFADGIVAHLGLIMSKVSVGQDDSDVDSILESMRVVAKGTEELISDYTYFASFELAKAARSAGFKVMLSGMGGDEVFGGYPRYRLLRQGLWLDVLGYAVQWGWLRGCLRRLPAIAKKVDRFAGYYSESEFGNRYARLLGYFTTDELRGLLGENEYDIYSDKFVKKTDVMLTGFQDDNVVIRAMILDYYGFLSHNLTVADKSSMSVGLELRVPLLDQDLYCGYISALRNGDESILPAKKPLKLLLRGLLPNSLLDRKKSGFNPPLDSNINSIGESRILLIFRSSGIGAVLNIHVIEAVVRNHFSGTHNNTYKIWQLLYLSFWLAENELGEVG
jgi:asparagine synthase (glutamine-hydrolysing)